MLCRRLDRADIEDFFRFGVTDAFGGKREDTKDNKDDSENGYWSHTS